MISSAFLPFQNTCETPTLREEAPPPRDPSPQETGPTRQISGRRLAEIGIAGVVVAVLLAVGLPVYENRVVRQIVEEALATAAPAKDTVQEFATAQARLPTTREVALPFVTSKYVSTTSWTSSGASGALTVWTRSGPHGELDTKVLVLTGRYDSRTRSVTWACGGTPATTVAAEHLPDDCRPR